MGKKILFITLALLFTIVCNNAFAQVYTITAKYSVQSIYSTGKYAENSFQDIDTSHHYTFIADLNNKTISDPISIFNTPYIEPITEIIQNAENHSYILKTKKETGAYWNYYKLQLTSDDSPLYIQKVQQIKGTTDTFYHTHTNNLGVLSFYRKCLFMKDSVLTGSQNERNGQMKKLGKVPHKLADNILEMHNGYIDWKIGKKEMHHLLISSTTLIKEDISDGITVRCSEKDGEFYDISYMNTDRKLDPDEHYKTRFIVILKYVNDEMVYGAILR